LTCHVHPILLSRPHLTYHLDEAPGLQIVFTAIRRGKVSCYEAFVLSARDFSVANFWSKKINGQLLRNDR